MDLRRSGVAVLLALAACAAGAQAKPALQLVGISPSMVNTARPPADPSVPKAVAAAAGAYTGRTVTVTWAAYPPDTSYLRFLQMREAARNLPGILLLDDLPDHADAYEYAIRRGLIRSFTAADLSKHMPGYVARFRQYAEDAASAFAYTTRRTGEAGRGRLWYIPCRFDASGFPAARTPGGFFQPSPEAGFTGGMFRDDLLKKVYPSARTEAEFRRLLLEKNGALTLDDMADVPMRSWNDLYDYGRNVKALNAEVGGVPVVPLGGILGSSEDAGSFLWSQSSATGYLYRGDFWWQGPPRYLVAVDASPEAREQARWLNRFSNEGLLDPGIFVMSDARYRERIGNGEYGVFAWHVAPGDTAISRGRERGYGWRPIPFFSPLDLSRVNNRYSGVSLAGGGIFLTSSIAAADLPDVLRYIDWFMTEASDDLAYWGLPAWSTGTGAGRRFKPEYKALEDWTVYGTTGARDGTFHGLAGAPAAAGSARFPYDVKPFAFFRPGGQAYPGAPYWSYRAGPAWNARSGLANVDLLSWVNDWWLRRYIGPSTAFYRADKGWDWWSAMETSAAGAAYRAHLDAGAVNGLIARAITGPAGDFDDGWDRYVVYLRDAGLDAYEQEVRASLAANWESTVLAGTAK